MPNILTKDSAPNYNGVAQFQIANSAIRDTTTHTVASDTSLALANVGNYGGRKLLCVSNTLGQTLSVQLVASLDASTVVPVGAAQNATSGGVSFIDTTALAQLANPYPYVGVQLSCSVAPTTGSAIVTLLAAAM